jgi:hypothetical protein
MSHSRLNIKRKADIDWLLEWINPAGVSQVETCVDGRPTEVAAIQRMAYGDEIPATNNPHTMNGILVDLDTQLYCRGCRKYLFDREFKRDKTRKGRRGRAYVCKQCERKKSTII